MQKLKKLNMIAPSPSIRQRNQMKTVETIPLNLEPKTTFFKDPVAVFDFQSLYPSIMISQNYCYSTCLGEISNFKDLVLNIKRRLS